MNKYTWFLTKFYNMYNPNICYIKPNLNNTTIYGIQDTMKNFVAQLWCRIFSYRSLPPVLLTSSALIYQGYYTSKLQEGYLLSLLQVMPSTMNTISSNCSLGIANSWDLIFQSSSKFYPSKCYSLGYKIQPISHQQFPSFLLL